MQNTIVRFFGRIAAGLLVLHVFFFWAAEKNGIFFGFEPAHFKDSAVLFFLIAIYLLLESHFIIKEREVVEEEIVTITEPPVGGLQAASPVAVWQNPYIASAIIVGVALIIAGVMLTGPKKDGGVQGDIANASPAPAAQQPAGQQPAVSVPAAPAPRTDVTFGDTPILNKNAKVKVIEFTDFQCPFCGRFFTETYPQIKKAYIDTGKIAFQSRDYPLPFHPNAQKAAEAARCALVQGETQYWAMHDWMYANQTTLEVATLKNQAKTLKLNSAKFDQCLDGGTMAAAVKKDYDAGAAYGVSGTPSFFVNGEMVVGAQPFSAFQQAIDKALAQK